MDPILGRSGIVGTLMCRILSRKKHLQPVNPSYFKGNSRVPWCFESRSPLSTLNRFQVNGKNARFPLENLFNLNKNGRTLGIHQLGVILHPIARDIPTVINFKVGDGLGFRLTLW